MNTIRQILFGIYYITLMPYIERDRYFDILMDSIDDGINQEIIKIISNKNKNK